MDHLVGQMKRKMRDLGVSPYLGILIKPGEARSRWQSIRDDRFVYRWIQSNVLHGEVCWDVGANEGTHLRRMVRKAPMSRHVAIEPDPALAEALRTRFPTVEVLQVAVSETAGQQTFWTVEDRKSLSGFNSSGITGARPISVAVTTLDDVLADGPAPFMVKIDVEGHELQVLRGARRVLEACHAIAFEQGGGSVRIHGPAGVAEVFELLSSSGFKIYDSTMTAHSKETFLRSIIDGRKWNWLAVKES